MARHFDKSYLEHLYEKYNDRKFIHPDPLEFLYNYPDLKEREVAGIITSSLAYGQVKQILKSVSGILNIMGKKPSEFLKKTTLQELEAVFSGFKHRFTNGRELAVFLSNIGSILRKYGSLNCCFMKGYKKGNNIIYALLDFIRELRAGECDCYNSLVPLPTGKCAYKRLNLFLRWMVRKDNIDIGGWDSIPASELIIPLDIHMYRIAIEHNLTERKQADMTAAIQITDSFKKFCPKDPVKYDFALTRLGMKGHYSVCR
ncbi:MAG: TIGR02757 family protein [Actinobacteria bacterium]|nr:TIGR02757 family protein [Actinomycetota bacterium]